MSIFTWIGKAAQSVGKWFSKAFKNIQTDAAPVAVAIIEEIQTFLKSGTGNFVVSLLDTLTKSGVPSTIVAAINKELPTILAAALALEGLPTNPTDAQLATFEQAVLAAFGVTSDKSKLYTTVGAQLIGIIRANTAPGQKFTFATLVIDLEKAYTDYINDKADPSLNQ
jgi:hypothetical protein